MTKRLLAIALLLLTGGLLTCSQSDAQEALSPKDNTNRITFVAECVGGSSDTKRLTFCNCAYTKLVARYGIDNFGKQDNLMRSSNAKELVQLARLAWKPELDSCRSQ